MIRSGFIDRCCLLIIFCKQFGPRSGFKLFDTLKEFLEKVDFVQTT